MSNNNKKCLIVDDDAISMEIASNIVERLGFSVLEASDGIRAMEMCEKENPDLIFLDLYMPEMDGMEFLTRIRAEESQKMLKAKRDEGFKRKIILICSAEHRTLQVGKTAVAGANDYLMKPYRIESVRQKLTEMGAL